MEQRHRAEVARLEGALREQQREVEKLQVDVELRDQMLCMLAQPDDEADDDVDEGALLLPGLLGQ